MLETRARLSPMSMPKAQAYLSRLVRKYHSHKVPPRVPPMPSSDERRRPQKRLKMVPPSASHMRQIAAKVASTL
eukprot:3545474-Rhodomonas_salina.1